MGVLAMTSAPSCAWSGDDHLEGLGRVLGQLLRPEPLDQPGGAAAPAEVAGEQREQAAAGDR